MGRLRYLERERGGVSYVGCCREGVEEERKYINCMIDGMIGCSSNKARRDDEKGGWCRSLLREREGEKWYVHITLHKETLCLYPGH